MGEEGPELDPVVIFVVPNRRQPADALHRHWSQPDGDAEKDTLRNVEETSAFVLDIGSLSFSNTMHKSSNNHSPEADEFERIDPLWAPAVS